ncbi:putative sporulation protein YyaC [Aneurinibacillus soli]|uniref:Uncharacterized protein n=1 Tax=Aneurinibacillus soli TaxID=1500254 RepID=A0A0U5BBA9_9BACL|nr:spore protease YyaC [Aneurinibacillus soli]PYE64239.1 putative sporulation protein YyaC [Aneurinibacillus soli]BAU28188.1 hypothetical protein CB4_02362 [Aneurinibacillus soli]
MTSKEEVAVALRYMLPTFDAESYVFACIGTDRSTGDSLGPLVGSKLAADGYDVIGTLDKPLHAVNLEERLSQVPAGKTVIAIDACLGSMRKVGTVSVTEGPLKPGAGVGKKLVEVGDYHIKAFVNVGTPNYAENYFNLANTRLSIVFKLASVICDAIMEVIAPVVFEEVAASEDTDRFSAGLSDQQEQKIVDECIG